ncbi:cyclin-D2-1-like isoform X1 [Camellia sinensis]|uniref:cyclin-D2-1-like isoform X1 n=1 Tax=Camellia sinensis TaxID=4442 RepID=UPI001036D440|nr:cyclin-D2-1-like isoform X1 [Camellia sinensis]
MSVFPTLHCSEAASEVVSSNDNAAGVCQCIITRSTSKLQDHDEGSIVHMFDSELDQLLEHELLRQLLKKDEIVEARLDAIDWMLKVHGYYNFRDETAYLSVNYLDRFLCSHALPEGKRWLWQLLSVACLSLAAKMEETRAPLLLDLQVLEPKFMFEPKTVQRMELFVMAKLRWRLRVVTPFDFVDYFIAKLQCLNPNVDHFCCLFYRVQGLILSSCQVVDFLDYTPSTIAAAAVLCTIDEKVNDHKTIIFHEKVSKELVKRCCQLFKGHLKIDMFRPAHNEPKILKSVPPSPVGVIEAASAKTCEAEIEKPSKQ